MTSKTLSKKQSRGQEPARLNSRARSAKPRAEVLEDTSGTECERSSQLAQWAQLLAGVHYDEVDSKPFLVEMFDVVAGDIELLEVAASAGADIDLRRCLNRLWWRMRAAREAAETIEALRRTELPSSTTEPRRSRRAE